MARTTSKKALYAEVLAWFAENMPSAQSELNFENPYQLLVAVILSAQCTDKRVNMVTPALFARFPDARSMSRSDEAEIYSYIKSVSYPTTRPRTCWAWPRCWNPTTTAKCPKRWKT